MGEMPADAVPNPTGDPRVDEVVARLDAVDALDVAERTAAFAQLHTELAAVLDGDEDPAPEHLT